MAMQKIHDEYRDFLRKYVFFIMVFLCFSDNIAFARPMALKEKLPNIDIVYSRNFPAAINFVFCEKGHTKVIYADLGVMKAADLQGRETVLFRFQGDPNRYEVNINTLSCAYPSGSISIMSSDENLFYFFDESLSIYQLETHDYLPFEDQLTGIRPIVSPSGSVVVLPATPHLISGKDLLLGKKIIISAFPVLGWVYDRPFTFNKSHNLSYIDESSGSAVELMKVGKDENISGVTSCAGEAFVSVWNNKDDYPAIFRFSGGLVDKKPGPWGDEVYSNGRDCVFQQHGSSGNYALSNMSRSLSYVAPKNPKLLQSGDAYSAIDVIRSTRSISGDGCLLLSEIGLTKGMEHMRIYKNGLQHCD